MSTVESHGSAHAHGTAHTPFWQKKVLRAPIHILATPPFLDLIGSLFSIIFCDHTITFWAKDHKSLYLLFSFSTSS